MLNTYLPPWDDDIALYPGRALEQHSAHCRVLGLPDSTHPADVRPHLTQEAIDMGLMASAMEAEMTAWVPDEYNRHNSRSVKVDILTPGYRHYAFWGGRGGSKSHGAAEAIVELASIGYENVVCGREFMNSIRDSSRRLLVQKIKSSEWADDWVLTATELRNKVTGSIVTFMGMNRNPDSARSLEGCTIFFGEEAESFSEHSLEVLLPTVRTPGSRFIWLWNPVGKGPVDRMFRGEVLPERSLIRCVLCDNNVYFYRTEMPSERRAAFRTMTKAKYRHVWRGALDVNPERAVYSEWSVGRLPLPPEATPRYGLDWGWIDPFACLEFYVLEPKNRELERGKIYIATEVYGSKIPGPDLPGKIKRAMPLAQYHMITADNSEPKSIEDFNNSGLPTQGARKGPGSIRAGITTIQGYDIVVSPDCPNVAVELESYTWKVNKDGTITRDPEDANNHALDALRYGMEDYFPDNGGVDYV